MKDAKEAYLVWKRNKNTDCVRSIIMTFPNERDIRLHNFNKTFSKDLDETIVQQEKEIKQKYSQEFDHELTQAELCAKNGDMLGAIEHKLRAEMINDFLKSLA